MGDEEKHNYHTVMLWVSTWKDSTADFSIEVKQVHNEVPVYLIMFTSSTLLIL
jgi:hypothetical protein